jgi:hypothetical protein
MARRAPVGRTGSSTTIHALHSMMMMMTDVEEWGKIHTPNDAALREPGAPRGTALVFESLYRPALGVD